MRTKLNENEQIKIVAKAHWLPILIYPAILLIICLLIPIKYKFLSKYLDYLDFLIFCSIVYKVFFRKSNSWAVTNFRVIEETGIFAQITKECSIDKIINISYNQTIWGRIFGYGNVIIQTAGRYGVSIFKSVCRPKILKETITIAQQAFPKPLYNEQETRNNTSQIFISIESNS